ncbi:hypothetical protein EVAR_83433_1 [Eumeta japonica]|uniref:Uncharacterized protein n=1 Tax=Eumeta variegata TaxID=151549 RepID=A0A4C1TYP9_EUMVA|nr:hypothetical protein EVAR_83433_1 [Eumeta japonica]
MTKVARRPQADQHEDFKVHVLRSNVKRLWDGVYAFSAWDDTDPTQSCQFTLMASMLQCKQAVIISYFFQSFPIAGAGAGGRRARRRVMRRQWASFPRGSS